MTKLLPIYIIAIILVTLSEKSSVRYIDEWGEVQYVKKDIFFYVLMAVVLSVFVGLRTRGNDTGTYLLLFQSVEPGVAGISQIQWARVAGAPGLQFIAILLKTIGASSQDYLMFFAIATISIYLWFIQKYSCNRILSVFLFLVYGGYTFAMAAIKQSVATALLLVATDRAIQGKYKGFLFWVLIAELFHPYSFIYLIVPFLFFAPGKKQTAILIVGTIAIAIGMRPFLGFIDSMTSTLGYNFDENVFARAGVNAFRVLVAWVPVVLIYVNKNLIQQKDNKILNLLANLCTIHALIMFLGLFGTANYFARLANYFIMFQVLTLPYLLDEFNRESRVLLTTVAVICYSLFFYYEAAIVNGAFDDIYSFITVGEYLAQLFGG